MRPSLTQSVSKAAPSWAPSPVGRAPWRRELAWWKHRLDTGVGGSRVVPCVGRAQVVEALPAPRSLPLICFLCSGPGQVAAYSSSAALVELL